MAHFLIGFVCWATRRRTTEEKRRGLQISYLKRSAYGALLPFAVLSLFVDIPVSILLLPALGMPEPLQLGIRLTIFLAGILMLAALLGDRWHISSGKHCIADKRLLLKVGIRFQATVPLYAIQDVQLVGSKDRVAALWSRREVVASPFDKPNLKLLLNVGQCVEATAWGCTFKGVRCIYLYVDEPKFLVAQLRGEP